MTKTITLSGTETKVKGLGDRNTLIINDGNNTIYASANPNVEAFADNVIAIKAGQRDVIPETYGTVYVLGTGRVELRGVRYVNFNQPSSQSSGGGGGTTGGVSQDYVDTQDALILASAKKYTDRSLTSDEITDILETVYGLDTEMPYMDGIVGYFTPDSCTSSEWKNLRNEDNNMSINSDIIIDNNVAIFEASTKGIYSMSEEPAIIYAIMATESLPNTDELDIMISKGVTSSVPSGSGLFLYAHRTIGMLFGAKGGPYDIQMPAANKVDPNILAVYTAVKYDTQAHLYVNGIQSPTTKTHNKGYYTGHMIVNGEEGSSLFNTRRSKYMFLAFGTSPHTDEQIKANYEWLKKKYLGG